MKIITLAALGLLLACAVPGAAQKYKNKNKNKDKRFETVVKENPSDYAGRYTGIDAEHYLEVQTDAAGRLIVTSFEGARRATLTNIRLRDGARLTATKVYEDGTTRDFAATFSNRIMNGTTTFGLIVEEPLAVSTSVMLNRVFYRKE